MMTEAEWEAFERDNFRPPSIYRDELFDAQGGICAICGAALLSGGSLSVDHVIPKSRGGPDAIGNFTLTHWVCNNRKGSDMPHGCQLIFLLAVNARLGVQPDRW